MRKFTLVFVTAILLASPNAFARPIDPVDGKVITAQIGKLLEDNIFTVEDVDLEAQVRLTFNNEREIVVLSVDTENKVLEAFVKARLNYERIDLADFKEGEIFVVPVRIKG